MRMDWVAPGLHHSAIIDRDGFVWVSGSNLYGQLGLEPIRVQSKLESIWQLGENKKQSEQPKIITIFKFRRIPHLTNIVNVSCGSDFTACVDDEGHVWTFGRNSSGQLGHGHLEHSESPTMIQDFMPNIILVHCGSEFMILLDSEGFLYSCGDNKDGALGLDHPQSCCSVPSRIQLKNMISLCVGSFHTICWDHEGQYFAFGRNDFGQLGTGDCINRSTPEMLQFPCIEEISCVSCFVTSTWMITSLGNVFFCGSLEFDGFAFKRKSMSEILLPDVIELYPDRFVLTSDRKLGSLELSNEGAQLCLGVQVFNQIDNVRCVAGSFSPIFCLDSSGDCWTLGPNSTGQLGMGKLKYLFEPHRVSTTLQSLIQRDNSYSVAKSARK